MQITTKKVILNGLIPSDSDINTKQHIIDLVKLREQPQTDGIEVDIHDARPLQEKAASPAEFFEEYGFVLLNATTAVQDWDTDLESVYFPEVEGLIRKHLVPNHHVTVRQRRSQAIRRGAGQEKQYAPLVHSDFGQTPDEIANNIAAHKNDFFSWLWKTSYSIPFVSRTCMFNFWRTTKMKGPLEHMPMALCLPSSVRQEDLVRSGLENITKSGRITTQMSLRYNPNQKWFWYPNMTHDEVLVFKSFDCRKEDNDSPLWRNVFHTAFVNPDASEDCEPRQSIDHRPVVTFCSNELSEACVIA